MQQRRRAACDLSLVNQHLAISVPPQEAAAAGVTLTTPPDEVSAAAQVVALQPFMDATLLEAAQEALAGAAGAGEAAAQQAASTPGK